jgi:uncharacterized protein (TIGR02147 family)
MDTLYEANNYREYLHGRLGAGARLGLKTKAAAALSVNTTLISQILGGTCEMSLEQAENMNRFLGHTDEEGDYFLWLVLKERSGSKNLKARFARQLEEQKTKRLNLSKRMSDRDSIDHDERERFYSTYLHGAIHVLVSIPEFQTREALATALGTPLKKINEAVEFLLQLGVITETAMKLAPGAQHIHLGSDSTQIVRHHLNWRLKAMERIGEAASRDLHYSVAVSLSEADVQKIKEMLLKNLSEVSKVVNKSKEETAFVFCFDFFELVNR